MLNAIKFCKLYRKVFRTWERMLLRFIGFLYCTAFYHLFVSQFYCRYNFITKKIIELKPLISLIHIHGWPFQHYKKPSIEYLPN